MAIVLIGGGSRSGKSRYSLEVARQRGRRRAYVATAEGLDEEMRERIQQHRAARGDDFTTIESPLEVAVVLKWQSSKYDVIVVDCLTLWLSNQLRAGRDIEAESERLLGAVTNSAADVVLVANEVGCGVVPDNELARRFRDHAGRLNQQAAEVASQVYWMAFGCPLKVK